MHTKSTVALCAFLAMTAVAASSAADPTSSAQPQPRAETAMPSNQGKTAIDPKSEKPNAATAPRTASSADRANYAAKEAQSPGAKNYKGGDDVVVISAGTTALILGIVLLIVLL
jgi:hypothetical protein